MKTYISLLFIYIGLVFQATAQELSDIEVKSLLTQGKDTFRVATTKYEKPEGRTFHLDYKYFVNAYSV